MSEGVAKRRKTNDGGHQVVDPRFANIHSDPRYRLPSKKQKIKLDSRFKKALKGDAFAKRSKVDRYGRKVKNELDKRRLERQYDLDEDEEASDEPDDDDAVQEELARLEKRHDPLREGKLSASSSDSESDSSSEEESEDDADVVDDVDDDAVQEEAVPTGEVSRRIAIVNLDWDNIRAQDLMAVFSSFLATGDRLLQVSVYPSDFGRERMEREELEGPPKEIFARKSDVIMLDNDSDDDDKEDAAFEEEEDEEDIKASIIIPDDGSEFDSQALRQYQLERLRYFFAVLTFSSEKAAKNIYDAVDGTEYLTTANFFDLRFIPEEMDFSDDKARDSCSSLSSDYKPNDFVTDALQHSKVKLTWDQEDRSRKDAQARAFRGGQKEIDENDLKAYLGSDSSSDEEELVNDLPVPSATSSQKQTEREKARALLGFATESTKPSRKDKDLPLGDVQVTFSSGLSGPADADAKKRTVFENSPEPNETTAEKYIRKERERKQRRKDKMKAQRAGAELDDDDEPVEAPPVAGAEPDSDSDRGFDDPFFNDAMNDVALKNKVRKEERLKKRKEREAEEAASAKQRAELELLMAEDDNETAQAAGTSGNKPVRHFDMTEIEKAEKRKGKKDKFRKKHDKAVVNNAILQDDFKMNVTDPRLGRLFEDHEFAIDPTNQKLKQTTGMKELMEENRKRRNGKDRYPSTSSKPVEATKTSTKLSDKASKGNEVRDLVAKLKRKTAT